MLPVLFRVGDLVFPSYFVLASFAYVFGTYFLSRKAQREGRDAVAYVDMAIIGAFGAFVGARLFFVLFAMPEHFLENPSEIFKFWQGGFVFYGGMIVGVLAGWVYVLRKKMGTGRVADHFAVSFALAMALGRLACFFAGCCYGRECDLAWPLSITFHAVGIDVPQARPLGVPLIPTQIYLSLLHCVLYFLLLKLTTVKRFNGQIFLTYLGLYSIGRFVIEYFRNDDQRGFFFGGFMSTSQLIATVTFVVSLTLFIVGYKKYASSTV